MISQYWINQIPARPLAIDIKDQSGANMNLSGYTSITAKMVGSSNEDIDLTGSNLITTAKSVGKLTFVWPTDRSLFTKTGDYQFQIRLAGTGVLDMTTVHTIRVKELGKVTRG